MDMNKIKRECHKCEGTMKVITSMIIGDSLKGKGKDRVMFECQECGAYKSVCFKIDLSDITILDDRNITDKTREEKWEDNVSNLWIKKKA